jgi:hypothetical protein
MSEAVPRGTALVEALRSWPLPAADVALIMDCIFQESKYYSDFTTDFSRIPKIFCWALMKMADKWLPDVS